MRYPRAKIALVPVLAALSPAGAFASGIDLDNFGRSFGYGVSAVASMAVSLLITLGLILLVLKFRSTSGISSETLVYRGHRADDGGLFVLTARSGGKRKTVRYFQPADVAYVQRVGHGALKFVLLAVGLAAALLFVNSREFGLAGAYGGRHGDISPVMVALNVGVVIVAFVFLLLLMRGKVQIALRSGHSMSVVVEKGLSDRLFSDVLARMPSNNQKVSLESAWNDRVVAYDVDRITSFGDTSKFPVFLLILAILLVWTIVIPIVLVIAIVLMARKHVSLTMEGGYSLNLGTYGSSKAIRVALGAGEGTPDPEPVPSLPETPAAPAAPAASGEAPSAGPVDDDGVEFLD